MFPPRSVRYGANYVPSRGWFYSWLDFSADDARRDLADLAGIGLDHVRVFPVWPWIQPNRTLIRRRAVDDLLTLVDVAAEFGLSVAVDLLQGHLSSFDFLPSWVLTHHGRSVFTDEAVRQGIATYVDVLTREVAAKDNVFAVTLGNEVNNLWPHNPTDSGASRRWAAELLDVARAAAPHLLTLHSLYDATWYDPAHPFHPADNVDLGDLTTVHSWVFNGVSAIDGPLGPATLTHADYLVELAAATATDPARPVWLQEVGAPRPDVGADDAAPYTRGLLEAVGQNPALWGVTWWCSHDLDRGLADFPEREYDLGLFTVDHQAKPAAKELEAHVRAARAVPRTRPALVCPADLRAEPERRAEVAPGSAFHGAWVRRRRSGPVAVVTARRAGDEAYLQARGIDTVLQEQT
ncbi:glycoside hydrolase 5 family protein [Thermoactinospora rubra]|uniref:glycoside hydrolase 5 family protein n=1 Tax=Thermoactinospora rubra TaxID=1088767 RepID=UPI000A10DF50|nr:glycosyl hydrolase [Thermoactinospora rubra]